MEFGYRRRSAHLPSEVTSFVGRQEELARVDGLLRSARLVSLVGPGGVGKTRLALRAAAAVKDTFPDGLRLAELTELRDAELLPATLVSMLELPQTGGKEPLDLLVEHLRHRRLLLILDTCEHLVDACALFADLVLRQAPGVTVLVTSRQPLDVPGEHTYVVPPLDVEGDAGDGGDGGYGAERAAGEGGYGGRTGADGSAVTLFAQRAAAVVPGFRVTGHNRAQVVAMCRRLDGIPLAIELATVRLRALSLEQLAARLEDRFLVLTGGRRTALPRHQTLRTTIGWSHELCSPEERLLWARLSVFAGTFEIRAVEQVCAGGDLTGPALVEHLVALVDKSVVLRVEDVSLPRYRLLDTAREYGAERLAGLGEEKECRERHLAWFRAAAERFHAHSADADQRGLVRDIARDLPNFRRALEYAYSSCERPHEALALAGALSPYWTFHSAFSEAQHWLRRGLELCTEPVAERAEGLCHLAYHTAVQGGAAAAMPHVREASGIAERLGDERLRGLATHYLGFVHLMSGEAERAGPFLATARALLEAAGERHHLALNFVHEAVRAALLGRSELSARNQSAYARVFGREATDDFFRSFLHYFHGLALWTEGHREESADPLREAVRLKADLREPNGMAVCLETLAWHAADAERHVRAAWLLGAADAFWQRDLELMWGVERLTAFHDEAMARVTEALGESRRDKLMRRGRALPVDQAVELAASDREHPNAPASGGSCAPSAAHALLTCREREVAGLVAQGLTNRQIAERLVISKRTADAHVEHIFSKLGCSARGEIAPLLDQPTAATRVR